MKVQRIPTQYPGVELHAVTGGNPKKPSIIFLHGFPDSHHSWVHQLEGLSKDFHVVAFDLVGVGKSDLPRTPIAYKIARILVDIDYVIQELCPNKKVHLVGHDWGAALGWCFVFDESHRKHVLSYTAISGPHPTLMARYISKTFFSLDVFSAFKQFLSSWYIYAIHIPWLFEFLLKYQRNWLYKIMTRKESLPNDAKGLPTMDPESMHGIVNMLSLYRKNVIPMMFKKIPPRNSINVPTQIILGLDDPFIKPEQFNVYHNHITSVSIHRVKAGHWVHLSQKDKVTKYIADFVESHEE